MSAQSIFRRWDVIVTVAAVLIQTGITITLLSQARSDISDIRAAMAADAQVRQKELNEFSVYKTKVEFLESKTTQMESRMTTTEKQFSDLNANVTYVVRWVERQERQEGRRP